MKKNQEGYEPMHRYNQYREKKYSWEGRDESNVSAPEYLFRRQMVIDDDEREWFMYCPESVVNCAPLIISCHGGNENGWTQFMESTWDKIADEKGCVIVYPTSLTDQWDCDPNSKDERFLLKIIEELKLEKIIDEERIYLNGFSRGAMFAQCFAMRHSGILAGLSVISGPAPSGWLLNEKNNFKSENVQPLPVYQSIGENDNSLQIEFTGWRKEESTMSDIAGFNLKYWIEVNKCKDVPYMYCDQVSNYLLYKGIAPVISRSILDMGHGQLIDEPQIIWDHVFSPFYRNKNGLIIRKGVDDVTAENYVLCRNQSNTYLGKTGFFTLDASPFFERRVSEITEENGNEVTKKETAAYLPVSLMQFFGFKVSNENNDWYLNNRNFQIELKEDSCFAAVNGKWISQRYAGRMENGLFYFANKGILEEIGYTVSVKRNMVLICKQGSGLSEKTAIATEAYFPIVIEKERK